MRPHKNSHLETLFFSFCCLIVLAHLSTIFMLPDLTVLSIYHSNSILTFSITVSLTYSSNDLNPSFSEITMAAVKFFDSPKQWEFRYLAYPILDHSNTILAALSFSLTITLF
jgi:hypothetical protein